MARCTAIAPLCRLHSRSSSSSSVELLIEFGEDGRVAVHDALRRRRVALPRRILDQQPRRRRRRCVGSVGGGTLYGGVIVEVGEVRHAHLRPHRADARARGGRDVARSEDVGAYPDEAGEPRDRTTVVSIGGGHHFQFSRSRTRPLFAGCGTECIEGGALRVEVELVAEGEERGPRRAEHLERRQGVPVVFGLEVHPTSEALRGARRRLQGEESGGCVAR
ncbi:uncharacterized protein PFL1_06720 [Pseudozyma flocculosa PF-1]|uniref:Uncharacterized protein n=1 Tax=Pseudozyma flocculosa PF-1 TaxID=1277687 RepID=A0A061H506_9BASI|nr:uncharacterized protein PFL1_06720 [Pseudozyma flocculosa PF-1]EPQ25726.1 hypothetical protein PFL1_06720 [Pseudozyma flocculosa PF-1]